MSFSTVSPFDESERETRELLKSTGDSLRNASLQLSEIDDDGRQWNFAAVFYAANADPLFVASPTEDDDTRALCRESLSMLLDEKTRT